VEALVVAWNQFYQINFVKSYGKFDWFFLQQALRMKGFSPNGVDRLAVLLLKACKIDVRVNHAIGNSLFLRFLTLSGIC
jgi:hypothetical protein